MGLAPQEPHVQLLHTAASLAARMMVREDETGMGPMSLCPTVRGQVILGERGVLVN